ncbi:hypothetical protein [Pseudomonas sp. Xaverov 259]|uniref:hypothetical protein n=1 Tax=Pseudomonas sp. Xaverov 259 TaxID=2666086 RepID=UPI001C5AD459|nr:hypothetical protein [Pseudomonas sp. Xaverov 259]
MNTSKTIAGGSHSSMLSMILVFNGRDINHRVIGLQRLSASVWLDSAEDAFAGHSRHTAPTCAFGCSG